MSDEASSSKEKNEGKRVRTSDADSMTNVWEGYYVPDKTKLKKGSSDEK